jgi:plasmid stabilization system protein ParE
MARRFIVRPLAEADLEDAARWYEDERAGLAERFLTDVDRTFARVRERPLQFPRVSSAIKAVTASCSSRSDRTQTSGRE